MSPTSSRVQVPFTDVEISRFRERLPVLQDQHELWDDIVSLIFGGVTPTIGLGRPPSSVPQLIHILTGVGLRIVEDMVIDRSYESSARQLESPQRVMATDLSSRADALEADEVVP